MDLVLFCFVFFLVTIFSFSLFLSSSILEKFRLVGFDLLLFTFERKRKIEGSFVFWNKFKTQNFSLSIRIRKEKDILYR